MSDPPSPKRLRVDYDDSKDDIHESRRRERDRDREGSDRNFSHSRGMKSSDIDDDQTKDSNYKKSKSSAGEPSRREHTLVLRLTNKEQEVQECHNQIREMKQAQTQNTAQLRSMLLDPAINLLFQRMAKEMEEHKEKLKQKQNELSAWKFTPDSQTGMRLMAKCRMLLQENKELGKMISSGRTAKLEGEISLHKTLVTEMKKNQKELDEFVGELEEDVEGMQGMMMVYQKQLKDAHEQIAQLKVENQHLRTLCMPHDLEPGGTATVSVSPETTTTINPTKADRNITEADSASFVEESPRLNCVPVNGSSDTALRTTVCSNSTSLAQTSSDDSNLGSFQFKVTPDSGIMTQEEEEDESSMDVGDFPISSKRTSDHYPDRAKARVDSSECISGKIIRISPLTNDVNPSRDINDERTKQPISSTQSVCDSISDTTLDYDQTGDESEQQNIHEPSDIEDHGLEVLSMKVGNISTSTINDAERTLVNGNIN